MRWRTDGATPSMRSSVAASVRPIIGMRGVRYSGIWAAPDTSWGDPSALVMAAVAARSSRPNSTSVASVSGRGRTFSVTSVMIPSVPHDPASSLQRSYPVTFLTTRPPDLNVSPRPDTAVTPRKWSRAAPALIRRGPARFAATVPPMVPRPSGSPSTGP